MTGTFINVATVLVGTLLGDRLPESVRQRVLAGLGLITLVLGVDNALAWRQTNPYVLGGVLLAAIAIAASLGWGVGLAAVTVLVVEGGISLGAGAFDPILRGEELQALTSAGGILIIGIALKLLDVRDVRVGNFLPALVFAPALVGLVHALP